MYATRHIKNLKQILATWEYIRDTKSIERTYKKNTNVVHDRRGFRILITLSSLCVSYLLLTYKGMSFIISEEKLLKIKHNNINSINGYCMAPECVII